MVNKIAAVIIVSLVTIMALPGDRTRLDDGLNAREQRAERDRELNAMIERSRAELHIRVRSDQAF
ncbi:MAG TPA: hypothetical protein VNU68_04865 [Verrucomicrobiae bacterium]|nr:hypothetical protein [Verrucomicrobiae bacterium]